MMATAARKDTARTIRNNLKRFVSIAVICALGVAMFCGLRASCSDLREAADRFFDEQNLFDVQVLSTLGLDDDDLAALEDVEGVAGVEGGWSETAYTTVNGSHASVEVKALSESGLNVPYVVEGALPQCADEVAVTQKFIDASGLDIGDTVEIDEAENADEAIFARHPYTICGIVIDASDVNNPELSFRSSSTSDYTFIVAPGAVENTDSYTVAYLTLEGTEGMACFSDEYTSAVRAVTDRIEDTIRDDREAARTARVKGDAQAELDDARAEYEQERADAEAELADGKAELDDAAAQLADAADELADGQAQLDDGWAQIASSEQELADGRAQLADGEATGRAQVEAELAQAREDAQKTLNEQIEAGRESGLIELNRQFDEARQEAQDQLDAGIEEGYQTGLAQLDEQFGAARQEAQDQLDAQIEAGYQQGLEELDSQFGTARQEAQAELDAQIEAGYEQGKATIDEKFDAARADAIAQLDEKLQPARDQAEAELEEKLAPAYNILQSFTTQLEQIQAAIEQTSGNIASYQEALAGIESIDAQLAALDPNDEGYEATKAELEEQRAAYQLTLNILDSQVGGLDALNSMLAGEQEQAATIQASIDGVNAEIESAKQKAYAPIEAAREQGIKEIEERIAPEYQAALDQLNQTIEAQREAAQAELDARMEEEYGSALDTLKQTIEEQREAAQAELDSKLDAEYASALETLKQQIEKQRAAAQAELDARMEAEYASALATLDQTIADQRAAAQQTLEQQLAEGRATAYAQLEARLASARAELEEGAAQLADARAELVDAQAELDQGRADYEDGLAEYQDGLAEWQDGRAEADEQFADAEAELADAQADIDAIDAATWYVQPRSSLSSYSSISSDADSIEAIGTLFPIVFLIVAVLVSLTTITRLVEEERGLIGTYKALGYRNGEIFAKYLTYALAACAAGCIVGLFLGFIALPAFIFWVFDIMYLLPSYPFLFDPLYGFGGSLIFIVAIAGTAYLACRSEVRRTPAALMRPKAPRSGSRILLERIPFIWSRLSFLNKVTARNLFRYKRRFLMTVAGIMGCTALIVCGFAIKDSVAELVPEQYERIAHYDLMAVTESGNHDAVAAEVADDSRVDSMVRIYLDSTTLKYGEDEETVQLIVVPDDYATSDKLSEFMGVTSRDTSASIDLPDEGAVITQNASEVLGFAVGDTLLLQDSQLNQADIETAAIARNYLGNYVYMSATAYRAAFGDDAPALASDGSFAPNGMLVICSSANDAASLYDEMSDDSRYLSVTSTDELADDFSQSFMLINAVVAIVLGMAAALAFAVLFTLSTTNISERERELATIKVLGFRPREVHHYVNKETIILTCIGIVCGLPLGYVLGDALLHVLRMPSISFLTVVTPVSYVIAAVLPLVFALVVNLITNRTLNRIDMIEALKSVE
ncbi:FtsX-like permease family protein [Collinsella tanakaei]|nr:FtsX-like permease family protein [Collinsella tanakaei]